MRLLVFVLVFVHNVAARGALGDLAKGVNGVIQPLLGGGGDHDHEHDREHGDPNHGHSPNRRHHQPAVAPVYEDWEGPIPPLNHWHGTDSVDGQPVDYERPHVCEVENCEEFRFADGHVCQCSDTQHCKLTKKKNAPKCIKLKPDKNSDIHHDREDHCHSDGQCIPACIGWISSSCQICSCRDHQAFCSQPSDTIKCDVTCLADSHAELKENFSGDRHGKDYQSESSNHTVTKWRNSTKFKQLTQINQSECPSPTPGPSPTCPPTQCPKCPQSIDPTQAPLRTTEDATVTIPTIPYTMSTVVVDSADQGTVSTDSSVSADADQPLTTVSPQSVVADSTSIVIESQAATRQSASVQTTPDGLMTDDFFSESESHPSTTQSDVTTEAASILASTANSDFEWSTRFAMSSEGGGRRIREEDYYRLRHESRGDHNSSHNSSESYRTLPNGTIIHETVEEWVEYEESEEDEESFESHRRSEILY